MNIAVINLSRSPERKQHIINQLNKCGLDDYIIYPAFDGSHIANDSLSPEIMPPSYGAGREMKRGEIGCTMSHIGAISMAKSLEWPYTIIIEDDAVLCTDFRPRLEGLFKIIPSNWDHVFLGGHIYDFRPLIVPSLLSSPKVSGTYAYMINHTAYDKAINYLSRLSTTTDDLYEQMIRTRLINSYIYFPLFSYALQEYSYIWEKNADLKEHPSKPFWRDKL